MPVRRGLGKLRPRMCRYAAYPGSTGVVPLATWRFLSLEGEAKPVSAWHGCRELGAAQAKGRRVAQPEQVAVARQLVQVVPFGGGVPPTRYVWTAARTHGL